jgi:hypothetical protein
MSDSCRTYLTFFGGTVLHRQFAKSFRGATEQAAPRVGTTQRSEEALEEAITALLPTKKSPLFKVAHSHFSQFGKLLRGRNAWAVSEAVTLSPARAQNWAARLQEQLNICRQECDVLPVQIQSALAPLVTYLEHATTSVRARAMDTARICV